MVKLGVVASEIRWERSAKEFNNLKMQHFFIFSRLESPEFPGNMLGAVVPEHLWGFIWGRFTAFSAFV